MTNDGVSSSQEKDIVIVNPNNVSLQVAHEGGVVVDSAGASVGNVLRYDGDGESNENEDALKST